MYFSSATLTAAESFRQLKEADFIIRPLCVEDIPAAMKLSTSEGWNQTDGDWRLFMESTGSVCLAAEQHGTVIGTTTSIVYSNKVAWIAMVLVDKEYRGRGVSKALLRAILKQLAFCASIKLDATAAGEHVYRQFDFRDEYRIMRMTTSKAELTGHRVELFSERIESASIPEVAALDESIFGVDRTQLIEHLVKYYPEKSWMVRKDGKISGIALGRRGHKYHHIGPVVAEDGKEVKALIKAALEEIGQQPAVMDVLFDKHHLIGWLESIGFKPQRMFTRMFKKHNPFQGDINKQFLICGPEFG